jgi:hypothetical protein
MIIWFRTISPVIPDIGKEKAFGLYRAILKTACFSLAEKEANSIPFTSGESTNALTKPVPQPNKEIHNKRTRVIFFMFYIPH